MNLKKILIFALLAVGVTGFDCVGGPGNPAASKEVVATTGDDSTVRLCQKADKEVEVSRTDGGQCLKTKVLPVDVKTASDLVRIVLTGPSQSVVPDVL